MDKITKKEIMEEMSKCRDLMDLFAKAADLRQRGARVEYVNSCLNDCRKRLVNKTKKVITIASHTVPVISNEPCGFVPVNVVDIKAPQIVCEDGVYTI